MSVPQILQVLNITERKRPVVFTQGSAEAVCFTLNMAEVSTKASNFVATLILSP